jgi:hypothetical protein
MRKITYQQAKEIAIGLADNLGVATDTAGHISGEEWCIDEYIFVITAGGRFEFIVSENMIGEGFPEH